MSEHVGTSKGGMPEHGGEAGTAETRRGYDVVAERYATEIGGELDGKPLDRAMLDTLAELTSGAGVLDVGAGPGHVTEYLAGRGARVFGLDLSPAMNGVARRATALPFCAADMTALPIRSATLSGIVSLYAVIHLDEPARGTAYREFARVLRAGGYALIAFHTSAADVQTGQSTTLNEWWGHDVRLTFRYLDPAAEAAALARAGLELAARLDRAPDPAVEHASRRSYLLVRRRP
jgi:SAM-dependent methyltransferase